MAHRSDRRGDTPITRLALEVVERRLAPRVRISMMARSDTLHPKGRRYVGSLIRCSLQNGGDGHGWACIYATKEDLRRTQREEFFERFTFFLTEESRYVC